MSLRSFITEMNKKKQVMQVEDKLKKTLARKQ